MIRPLSRATIRHPTIYLHAARADIFPNSVIEALACGAPVIATAVGGVPEQVDDGATGFLVEPGDHEALAARLLRVLTDDPLRARFASQAVAAARQRFDLQRQADDYLAWYADLAQNFTPARAAEGR